MIIKFYKGRNLIINVPLIGNNFKLLNAMPGHTKWQERALMFRPVGANIKYILEHWPDAIWEGDTIEYKENYIKNEQKADNVRLAKTQELSESDPSGYLYERPPMEHQRKAFHISRDEVAFGLFMEQGTGKTKVIIDTAAYLYKAGLIDMLVIVAYPNGVHRNWIDYELPEDIPAWCDHTAEFWSSQLSKDKVRNIDRVLSSENKLKILSFNVEAFVSPKAQKYILRCVNENRCLLVIDQSASIKNPKAKRTQFLIDKVSEKATYRRVLDGAPVAEGAGELFSQFQFLDPLIIGHDTWTAFRAEFCQLGYFNNITGYKNLDELHKKIDGYSYRVTADKCLDLPPRVYKRWLFDLLPEERRIFDELKRESLAYFTPDNEGDGIIEEERALIKSMRLQQVTSGWFPHDGTFKPISDKGSRIVALKVLLNQIEGKALIFSRFRADLELLQKTLGLDAVAYHGGIGEEQREENKHRFMTEDSVRYFIGQPRTAGIGHTLTAAKHVIFYVNEPSLRFREECEKRVHRKGLEKTLKKGERLIIWDLIANRTNDHKTVTALIMKKELSNEIMKDPQNWFLQEEK